MAVPVAGPGPRGLADVFQRLRHLRFGHIQCLALLFDILRTNGILPNQPLVAVIFLLGQSQGRVRLFPSGDTLPDDRLQVVDIFDRIFELEALASCLSEKATPVTRGATKVT